MPVLELLMRHRSVRRYTDARFLGVAATSIIRVGQGAASSSFIQAYSVVRVIRPSACAAPRAASHPRCMAFFFTTSSQIAGAGHPGPLRRSWSVSFSNSRRISRFSNGRSAGTWRFISPSSSRWLDFTSPTNSPETRTVS